MAKPKRYHVTVALDEDRKIRRAAAAVGTRSIAQYLREAGQARATVAESSVELRDLRKRIAALEAAVAGDLLARIDEIEAMLKRIERKLG